MTDKYEALRNTARRDLAKDNYTTEEPRVILELLAERDALAEQIPKWQPIETAPKDTIARLLGYRNDLGNWRTVRGRYYSQEEIDDYWEYPEDAAPGWYETPANADEPPNVWFVTPTHWMPMPPAPKEQKQ